jgi:hypothetical protein
MSSVKKVTLRVGAVMAAVGATIALSGGPASAAWNEYHYSYGSDVECRDNADRLNDQYGYDRYGNSLHWFYCSGKHLWLRYNY